MTSHKFGFNLLTFSTFSDFSVSKKVVQFSICHRLIYNMLMFEQLKLWGFFIGINYGLCSICGDAKVLKVGILNMCFLTPSLNSVQNFSFIPIFFRSNPNSLLLILLIVLIFFTNMICSFSLSELKLYICNKYTFGFMLGPSDAELSINDRRLQFTDAFVRKISKLLSKY